MVASSLTIKDGKNAASFSVAEQYVTAFNKLARTNNTLILPANAADISGIVGQAMTIYKNLSDHNSKLERAEDQENVKQNYSSDNSIVNEKIVIESSAKVPTDLNSSVVDNENVKK